MKVLIIADPIASLQPRTDTGLAFLRAALARGHQVDWTTPQDLELHPKDVLNVSSQMVSSCPEKSLPSVKEGKVRRLDEFDTIWIRKDPPFDQAYVTLCWLLSLKEKEILILNRPSDLLRFHEKLLPYTALSLGHLSLEDLIPTWLPGVRRQPPGFEGDLVSKPWLGYGGESVQKHKNFSDLNLSTLSPHSTVIQPYQKEIEEGDLRLFFLGGEFVGGFSRVPPKGSIVSNLAQGGSAEKMKLNSRQKKVVESLEKFFQEVPLGFVGVDLIGSKVSEINFTAPTGVTQLKDLEGKDLADLYVQWVERKVS